MLTSTIDAAKQAQAAAKASNGNDLGSKDVFLKILVAQMQFQDPMKPQDPTQMSSQLAQYNMVEQQNNSNKFLEQIAGAQGSAQNSTSSSASYLGRTVTYAQNNALYNGTPINMKAEFQGSAESARVVVTDSSGSTVRTMDLGALTAGQYSVTWDGLTDAATAAPQGEYNFSIQAFDANGQAVPTNVLQSGVVNAVRFNGAGAQLMVNGTPVDMASVSELSL